MSALEEIKARAEGHTEGPWTRGRGITPHIAKRDWVEVSGHATICSDVRPADAELIAAAPKLLAALEAVEAVIAEHEARTPFPDADKESQWYSLGKRHGYERVRLEITEALQ